MKKNQKNEPTENEIRDVPPNAGAEEKADPATPETPQDNSAAEMEELKKQLDDMNDKYVRLLAEYDNFRKRTQREKDQLWSEATAATVTKMLPILDNFERSSAFETTDTAYKKGIDLIGAAFKETLDKLEVKEIPTEGRQFDPNLHNAVAHVENDELGENTIADCFQKGYMIGDKVIRHAMVQVAN